MSGRHRGDAFSREQAGPEGCFGPVSDELDRIEEVFFLCPQLLKAILLGQVLQEEMLSKGFALFFELLDVLPALFNGLLQLGFAELPANRGLLGLEPNVG